MRHVDGGLGKALEALAVQLVQHDGQQDGDGEAEDQPEQVQQEVADMCAKELPEYVQPAFYAFRDSMPYTPIGKIDYRKLESLSA
jgi:acyl-CoA synthetase (AMP-forming)/AMP-acid ligase II